MTAARAGPTLPAVSETPPPEEGAGEALIVDIDGFEGPLDLLLSLARTQKVDLRRLSILALAEQYLAVIERAQDLRLELAADWLVMAAWLAFLKSRLLLPPDPEAEGPSADEMAAALAERLARLDAMRALAARQPVGHGLQGNRGGVHGRRVRSGGPHNMHVDSY